MVFHERLAELRKKTGLSQKELSTRLGMARTTYSGYENGSREPDLNTLHKLSEFFEVDLNWLITGVMRELTEEEKVMVEDFSKLSEPDKEFIVELMKKMGR